MFEHVIFPASRRQLTQRSVHSAHPGGCACTAGSFGGTGDWAGASGTISADGNVCSAAQFAHGDGASAARATSAAITAATSTNALPQVRARRAGNESGIMIVSSHPEPTTPSLARRATSSSGVPGAAPTRRDDAADSRCAESAEPPIKSATMSNSAFGQTFPCLAISAFACAS